MAGKIELTLLYGTEDVAVVNKKNTRSPDSRGTKVVYLRRNPQDEVELAANESALLEVGVIPKGYVQETLPFM